MGSFYTNISYRSTKSFFEEELLQGYPEGLIVKDSALRGNIGFVLLENTNKKNVEGETEKFIRIYKIMKDEGEYYYKPFDETAHPYLFGCPEYILKQSNCMDEQAIKWRANNHSAIQKKKAKKQKVASMVIGNTYKVGQKKVKFISRYNSVRFVGLAEGEKENKAYRYESIVWND